MRHIGLEGYRNLWRRDLATAAELRRLADEHPRLESVGETALSIACFRYIPETGSANAFNRKLVDLIQKDGRLFVSGTLVDDTFCLRAAIINFRTTIEDARLAIDAIAELGAGLEADLSSGGTP
jgi:glutamate/tyrosine decarboxylase-like PLP-dependent enzyme